MRNLDDESLAGDAAGPGGRRHRPDPDIQKGVDAQDELLSLQAAYFELKAAVDDFRPREGALADVEQRWNRIANQVILIEEKLLPALVEKNIIVPTDLFTDVTQLCEHAGHLQELFEMKTDIDRQASQLQKMIRRIFRRKKPITPSTKYQKTPMPAETPREEDEAPKPPLNGSRNRNGHANGHIRPAAKPEVKTGKKREILPLTLDDAVFELTAIAQPDSRFQKREGTPKEIRESRSAEKQILRSIIMKFVPNGERNQFKELLTKIDSWKVKEADKLDALYKKLFAYLGVSDPYSNSAQKASVSENNDIATPDTIIPGARQGVDTILHTPAPTDDNSTALHVETPRTPVQPVTVPHAPRNDGAETALHVEAAPSAEQSRPLSELHLDPELNPPDVAAGTDNNSALNLLDIGLDADDPHPAPKAPSEKRKTIATLDEISESVGGEEIERTQADIYVVLLRDIIDKHIPDEAARVPYARLTDDNAADFLMQNAFEASILIDKLKNIIERTADDEATGDDADAEFDLTFGTPLEEAEEYRDVDLQELNRILEDGAIDLSDPENGNRKILERIVRTYVPARDQALYLPLINGSVHCMSPDIELATAARGLKTDLENTIDRRWHLNAITEKYQAIKEIRDILVTSDLTSLRFNGRKPTITARHIIDTYVPQAQRAGLHAKLSSVDTDGSAAEFCEELISVLESSATDDEINDIDNPELVVDENEVPMPAQEELDRQRDIEKVRNTFFDDDNAFNEARYRGLRRRGSLDRLILTRILERYVALDRQHIYLPLIHGEIDENSIGGLQEVRHLVHELEDEIRMEDLATEADIITEEQEAAHQDADHENEHHDAHGNAHAQPQENLKGWARFAQLFRSKRTRRGQAAGHQNHGHDHDDGHGHEPPTIFPGNKGLDVNKTYTTPAKPMGIKAEKMFAQINKQTANTLRDLLGVEEEAKPEQRGPSVEDMVKDQAKTIAELQKQLGDMAKASKPPSGDAPKAK